MSASAATMATGHFTPSFYGKAIMARQPAKGRPSPRQIGVTAEGVRRGRLRFAGGGLRVQRFKTNYRHLLLRWRSFDARFYRERYPDVIAAKMWPFAHYLLHGAAEGRKPNAWFDPDYYLARSAAARRRGGDPFVDYLRHGRSEGASPHWLKDGRALNGPPAEGSLFGCDS